MVSEHEDKADSSCDRNCVDSDNHFVRLWGLQMLMNPPPCSIRMLVMVSVLLGQFHTLLVYCTDLSYPCFSYPYIPQDSALYRLCCVVIFF